MKVYLTRRNSPRVLIAVRSKTTWQNVDCLIDTGFSSGIALSLSLLPKLQPTKVARQEFELANGSRVVFGVYTRQCLVFDLKSKPTEILLE